MTTMLPPAWNTETSLMHNMTDQELFLRVSMLSGIQEFQFYSIYVHRHPSFNATVPKHSVFYARNIPSQIVTWGRETMMEAERRLLGNALMDLSNQRFVLLSESCIPLFGFRTVYDYLMNSNTSFLSSYDDPGKDGRGRYMPEILWPMVNITDWRKGSQWFEMHRELAIHIVSDTKYFPIFRQLSFSTSILFLEEHYKQTLVHMKYPHLSSNRSVTWVDWSWPGAHPRTFVCNDISKDFLNLVRFRSTCVYEGNTTNMCFLFARKFHPDTLKPLLRLSPMLLGS
uniref:Core-2/I-branching beta-1,6-N-acetylglucosaminyltransferase family protein n=1 Tax=Cajanus cajan TaxID=3821 RepID=A0A151SXD2_CAJCA|nr:hypothetical protein KK1_014888 [Cajanus cajan]